MRKILIIALLSSLFCSSLFCGEVGVRLQKAPKSFWNMPANGIQKEFNLYGECKWKDSSKIYLLFKYASEKKKVYFFKQQIYKASFRFSSKQRKSKSAQQIDAIYLTLKKPSGEIDKDTYLKNISSLKNQIKGIGQLSKLKESKRKFGKWYRCSYVLNSSQYTVSLKWSYSSDPKAPFKVRSTKFSIFYNGTRIASKKDSPPKEPLNRYGKMIDKEFVKITKDKDDNYLNVPMIIEKSKAYNLQVAIERVLTYYSLLRGDQKDYYKIKKSNPEESNMLESLSFYDATMRCIKDRRIGVKKIIIPDCFQDYMNFCSLVSKYYEMEIMCNGNNSYSKNAVVSKKDNNIEVGFFKNSKNIKVIFNIVICPLYCKKHSRKKRGLLISLKANQQGKIIKKIYLIDPINNIFQKMNNEKALLKARSKRARVKHFAGRIRKQINDGKPVLWSVMPGLFEQGASWPYKKKSEYIRLIIGYNKKTNEFLYSDNLGKGHELKRMSWDKAWAITCGTLVLRRRKNLR